jgi:hypothetical protein
VVNSIEKEVLQSEWERWLDHETARCQQVAALLEEGSADAKADPEGIFADRKKDVQWWYEEYCLSCEEEQERLGSRSVSS